MPLPFPNQPVVQTFTTWTNPTDAAVYLDIHVGATFSNPSGRFRYVVPAHGEVQIPGEYDLAVHDTRDGVIVGGLGPQLRRKDRVEQLHQSLDANKSAEKEAQAEAEQALIAKQAAEQAVMLAVSKKQAAVEAQARVSTTEKLSK